MRKLSLLFLIIVLSVSCKNKTFRYVKIETNLESSSESHYFTLIDENKVYLFGENESLTNGFDKAKIIIEQASKDSISNWNTLAKSIKGVCRSVAQTDKNIFFISQQYTQKYESKNSSHVLYKVSKTNGSIELIYKWDMDSVSVRGLHFDSDKNGFVLFRSFDNSNIALLYTNNGGISWNNIPINKNIFKVKYTDDKIIMLGSEINYSSWILSVDKITKKQDSILIKHNVKDFAIDNDDNYLYLSRNNDKNETLLYKYDNGKEKEIKSFSKSKYFFPKSIYVSGSLISILCTKYSTNFIAYNSTNNGIDWEKTNLNVIYLEGIEYYKNKQMFAYASSSNILAGYNLNELEH